MGKRDNSSLKEYVDVFSFMAVPVAIVDLEGRQISANEAFCKLVGYSERDLVGKKNPFFYWPKKDLAEIEKAYEERVKEGNLGKPWKMVYIKKDGKRVPVSVVTSELKDSQGGLVGYSEVVTDITENRQTEEALHESIKKYYDFTENIQEGIITVDREGRITFVNSKVADMIGRTMDEMIGETVFSFMDEYAAKTCRHHLANLEKGGKKQKEFAFIHKNKERIYAFLETSPISDEKGVYIGAVASVLDITDRKESDRRLREANIELQRAKKEIEAFSRGLEKKVKERTFELSVLYEISNAISYTLNYQQLIKLIKESLFKLVDYDICGSLLFDELTADIVLKPAYRESAPYVDEIREGLITSTSVLTGEDIRQKQMNVTVLPLRPDAKMPGEKQFDRIRSFFNVPFVADGKIIGLINISSCLENAFNEEDIKLIYTIANLASTSIERLKAVITAEKYKMEGMVESMLEGVIMIDEQGEIVVINPQARYMLGFKPGESVASGSLMEKMKSINLHKALEECRDKKRTVSKEVIVPQEKSMILRCNMSPVKDAKGRIIGIVSILRDITREREVDRMKTEFISTVSHELRTPLSITREGLSLLLDKIPGDVNDRQKKILSTSKDNIDRLGRIINDLLNVSKIEAGKVSLKKEMVDINGLVREAAASFELPMKNKGLEIRTDVPTGKVEVLADADRIIQVLTNLLSNAIKFTEKGHIEISVREKEDEMECTVADTGSGISKGDMAKVFTRFQQFGRTAGAGEKGTGLGLSIAKGIIDMHHGQISVESEPGKGSRFIFTLPKYTTQALFEEYVTGGIDAAKKNDSNMSLVLLTITNIDSLKRKYPDEQIRLMLKSIEASLEDSLRREGDLVVKDTGEIIVLLADCDRESVSAVKDRLEKALKEHLGNKGLEEIKIQFGYATYPDEAENDVDLIKEAKKRPNI